MILKFIGAIWMIGPIFILVTTENVTDEIVLYGLFSFGMGLLTFNFKPKQKIEFNYSPPNSTIKNPPITHLISKPIVEIFVTDLNLIKQAPLRYSSGSVGETTRVLSENYYKIFFDRSKENQPALNFLKYRINSSKLFSGVDLEEELLILIANRYYHKLSYLIFFICCHEGHFEKSEITDDFILGIYNLILDEHNKICPIDQEEKNEFDIEIFNDIKKTYLKFISESTEDILEEETEDIFYDEITVNKTINNLIIKNLEEKLEQEIQKKYKKNKNPFDGISLIEKIQLICQEFKLILITEKDEFGITENDVEYIISKAYLNIYSKYFE